VVDLGDKRCTGGQRLHHVVRPVEAQQGHPGALGARYRAHRERRHLSQQLRQCEATGDQARQLVDPGPQVGGISADLFGGQRPSLRAVGALVELHHLRYLRSIIQYLRSIFQPAGTRHP
jgi:hypothetical protein